MRNIKYFNEHQFISDFAKEIHNEIADKYNIEIDKKIGKRVFDIFIENKTSGHTFAIEVKGRSVNEELPPEIIPWLNELKNEINLPKNHFIVLSLSHVNENVFKLFEESGISIFEFYKHKNASEDFLSYLENLAA